MTQESHFQVYSKELKAETQKDICASMLIAMLLTIPKGLKQLKCPFGLCIDKQNVVYIHAK